MTWRLVSRRKPDLEDVCGKFSTISLGVTTYGDLYVVQRITRRVEQTSGVGLIQGKSPGKLATHAIASKIHYIPTWWNALSVLYEKKG